MPAQPTHEPPSYYDDLDQTLAEAWRVLGRGTVDRRAPMHTPAVATTGLDGRPQVRTVVLRGLDVANRSLRFHTDRRSGKFSELTADPRIAILGYDAGRKVQLRIGGVATLHGESELAEQAWAGSRPMSMMCYRQARSPGSALLTPQLDDASLPDGRENFTVVVVTITEVEWLYLAAQGHRRARFTWGIGGALSAAWIAP